MKHKPLYKVPKPEGEDMGLFNKTIGKVAELEAELAAAHERIRNLEIALKAALADKRKAMYRHGRPFESLTERLQRHDLNTLSESDVEQLFEHHAEENAKPKKKWWEFFCK